eukprot:4004-Eustigmatos_ZCMA.PRE.1
MGDILEAKTDHLTPDADPPSGAIRPENCEFQKHSVPGRVLRLQLGLWCAGELDVPALRALGVGQETALRPGL